MHVNYVKKNDFVPVNLNINRDSNINDA
jgi:hypothetical protein